MKVAYILHDTDPFGGANRSFLQMLYAIMQKGIEPLVVLPNRNGIYNELQQKGIQTLVQNYRLNTYPYENGMKDYLLWLPRLIARRVVNAIAARQLAKRIGGFDIVHTNVSVVDIGARAARRQGIPHIYHFREYAGRNFQMRYFPCKKRFYQTVQHAICITRALRDYHHLPADTRAIYNGILSETTPCCTAQPDSKNYLLYAGRLEKTKGIEDLLQAYARSCKTLPLWIAGAALTNEYQTHLQQLCQQLHIDTQVQFMGARTDVLQLMADARAMIVPSFHEGFGRIMAEAMYQRCLTIGRDTDGIHEQFENGLELTGGEIGLRFQSIPELTTLIDDVLSSLPSQWDDYRDRAYTTVSSLYTDQACSEAIMNFYHQIIEQ